MRGRVLLLAACLLALLAPRQSYALDDSTEPGVDVQNGAVLFVPAEIQGPTFCAGGTCTWTWDNPGVNTTITFASGGVLVNATSVDMDWIFGGDGDASLLVIDAGLDAVGIGRVPVALSKVNIARATPTTETVRLGFTDLDTADDDVNTQFETVCPVGTSAAEDCTLSIGAQSNGTMRTIVQVVGDNGLTVPGLTLGAALTPFVIELADGATTANATITTDDTTGIFSISPGTTFSFQPSGTTLANVANAIYVINNAIVFEGAADANEGTLTTATLGGDQTWTLPDATGEVSVLGQTISDGEVDDNITLTNLTQITTRDIDDLQGQAAWGAAATKDTTDLIINGVEVDFEAGAAEGFPRLAQSPTPPAAQCDAAAEEGRLYYDTNEGSGSLMLCNSAGWTVVGAGGGSTAIDDLGDAGAGDDAVALAEQGQTWTWDSAATATAYDGLTLAFSHDSTDDASTQNGLVVERNATAGTQTFEALIEVNNNDTDGLVIDGIEFNVAAGGMTNAIDASATAIVHALDIGSNTITNSLVGETLDISSNLLTFRRNSPGVAVISGADDSSPGDTTFDTEGAGNIIVGSADVLSVTLQTNTSGGVFLVLADSGNTNTVLPNNAIGTAEVDKTTFGDTTWGSGTDFTWTFNGAGSDPRIRFDGAGAIQFADESITTLPEATQPYEFYANGIPNIALFDTDSLSSPDVLAGRIRWDLSDNTAGNEDGNFDIGVLETPTPGSVETRFSILGAGGMSLGSANNNSMAFTTDGPDMDLDVVAGQVRVIDAQTGIEMVTTTATECVVLDASAIVPDDTIGCGLATKNGTNWSYRTCDYDTGTTEEEGAWTFGLPPNFTGGTGTIQVVWSTATACTNGEDTTSNSDDVCWQINGDSFGDDAAYNTGSLAAPVLGIGDDCLAAGDIHFTTASTFTHSMNPNERGVIRVTRDTNGTNCTGGTAADDLNGDAFVHSVRFCYEVNNVFSGE